MKVSCVAKNYFAAPRRSFTARPENKRAGIAPAFFPDGLSHVSISGGCRTAPAEAVVHADLDAVLVVAEAGADRVDGGGRERRVAEVVILVLGLGRPVRGEQVFQPRADGVTVLAVA